VVRSYLNILPSLKNPNTYENKGKWKKRMRIAAALNPL
jgi:hypothetical protein